MGSIFLFLDNNWLYLLLFFFICVFIFREILIKKLEKLVASQQKLIRDQMELTTEQDKLINEFNFFKNDLISDKDCVGGRELSPKPNPKPKPKKQAKPKKKRK
jgi:DNA-binding protein H-NS